MLPGHQTFAVSVGNSEIYIYIYIYIYVCVCICYKIMYIIESVYLGLKLKPQSDILFQQSAVHFCLLHHVPRTVNRLEHIIVPRIYDSMGVSECMNDGEAWEPLEKILYMSHSCSHRLHCSCFVSRTMMREVFHAMSTRSCKVFPTICITFDCLRNVVTLRNTPYCHFSIV